jgi:opacity protein-like surface antigen
MKMKLFCIALLASIFSCAGLAQAATYTMDFNQTVERTSATGDFTIDTFAAIDSASIDFNIAGKRTMVNSRGYAWYYESFIDLSVTGSKLLSHQELGGDFTTLHFDLGANALSYMLANKSLNFDILGLDASWYSDLSPWGGGTTSRFYLDSVTLNVTPSAVPLPGAALLFGSGLLGLVGVAKRRKA